MFILSLFLIECDNNYRLLFFKRQPFVNLWEQLIFQVKEQKLYLSYILTRKKVNNQGLKMGMINEEPYEHI
jgi:hypothetical protein